MLRLVLVLVTLTDCTRTSDHAQDRAQARERVQDRARARNSLRPHTHQMVRGRVERAYDSSYASL